MNAAQTTRRLTSIVARVLSRMAHDAGYQLRQNARAGSFRRPDLSRWLPVMAEAVKPVYLMLMAAGIQQGADKLRVKRRRRKALSADFDLGSLEMAFDLYDPRVTAAIESSVLDFCKATLDTITGDVATGLEAIRTELGDALESGEGYRSMAKRIEEIIADPHRAARAAQTEAVRAVHTGEMMLVKESGVASGKRWLASSDACKLCLSFAAKGVIGLDEPFHVHPTGNPNYRTVMHPPGHVWCQCACAYEVDAALVGAPVSGAVLRGGAEARP